MHGATGYARTVLVKRLELGMKIYTTDWHTWYGLDYDQGADQLHDLGVHFALTLNSVDPAPISATPNRVAAEFQEWAAAYSDRRFREALGRHGIAYYAAFAVFFDAEYLRDHEDARPVNAIGQPMEQVGWYAGLCPSNTEYLDRKIELIVQAIRELDPDGVFLMFVCFPGFWERWVSGYRRSYADEYCFCRRCLGRFFDQTGVGVGARRPEDVGVRILADYRAEWTDWKCGLIVDVARRLHLAVDAAKPGCRLAFNTHPFGRADFANVIEEVFGQRFEALATVVDAFDLMTYHQVLKRGPDLFAPLADETKERTGKTVYCSVLSQPRYLDGIYRSDGRRSRISAGELRAAFQAVADSRADGIILRWEDYLEDLRDPDGAKRAATHSVLADIIARAGSC